MSGHWTRLPERGINRSDCILGFILDDTKYVNGGQVPNQQSIRHVDLQSNLLGLDQRAHRRHRVINYNPLVERRDWLQ